MESGYSSDDSLKSNNQEYLGNSKSDLLTQESIKIDSKYLVNYPKKGGRLIAANVKKNCKILKFSSEWNIFKILKELTYFNSIEYPNLFIFIIEAKNFGFQSADKNRNEEFVKIKRILLKFDKSRPMIMQLLSIEENITKFYYKKINSSKFKAVKQQQVKTSEITNFPTFLLAILDARIESFYYDLIERVDLIEDSAVVFRFLRLMDVYDNFFWELILKCTERGSKSDILAALNSSFVDDGKLLTIESQKFITDLYNNDQSSSEPDLDQDQASLSELTVGNQQNPSDNDSINSDESYMYPSVLSVAVEYSNQEVIDYLINDCTCLIQKLPYEHQLMISTATFVEGKLEVLCDLLEIVDFPFPTNFVGRTFEHKRLERIVKNRTIFHTAIKENQFHVIKQFIHENYRFVLYFYNIENKTALQQAVDSANYDIYYYLKSNDFQAIEFKTIEEVLDEDECKNAKSFAIDQRSRIVDEAIGDNSIMLLATKSFIRNNKFSKEQEAKYREIIKKWLEDINNIKFGKELLDVAASCESLKIIFDFECNTVSCDVVHLLSYAKRHTLYLATEFMKYPLT